MFIFISGAALLVAACAFFLRLGPNNTADVNDAEDETEDSLFAGVSFTPDQDTAERAIFLRHIGESGDGENEDSESDDGKSGDGESDSRENDRWELYIPSEDSSSLSVHMRNGYVLRILGTDGAVIGEWKNGDEAELPSPGVKYPMQLVNRRGECVEKSSLQVYRSENVASLYLEINSTKFQWINQDKNNSAECRYVMYQADGEPDASGTCKISGRGNTTWWSLEKSYNLNLTEAAPLLGMNKSSKYCILANVFDRSNMRNWTAQNLARDLSMPYTPQCEFVNVYINGAYNGMYLLSQRVRANGGSISEQQSEDLNSGAERVLIFDGRASDMENYIQTEHRTLIVSYPKDLSDEEKEEIQSCYQEAEKAVFAEEGINNDTGISVDQYIDLNSWEQMHVFQESFAQWDAENFSFYTCMLPDDTHIYAAPMWDFDLSGGFNFKGNYSTPLVRTQLARNREITWTCHLIRNSEQFREESFRYYCEELLPAMAKYLDGAIEDKAEEIRQAALMNRARWQFEDDPDAMVSWYVQWLRDRQDFLLDYWSDPDAYCMVFFDCGWGELYYYVKKGDELGFLPGCGMESGRYGEEIFEDDLLGWADDEGNPVTPELAVNSDITLHAVREEDN